MLKIRELKTNVWEHTLTGVLTKSDLQTMARDLTPILQGDSPFGVAGRGQATLPI